MFRGFLMCLKQQLGNEGDLKATEDRITPLHGLILIRELMEFYDEYEKVYAFLETVKSLDVHCKEFNYGGATLRNGMYLQALKDGLTEVEKLYNKDFGKLERALLYKEGVPELAVTDQILENGSSLYFASNIHASYSKILQIINILIANNLHGCQILDLCIKFKYFLPEEIFCLLLNYLNKPLLKQITSWIVFGKLEDPRDEFFIKQVESVEPSFSEYNETTTCTGHSTSNFSDTPSTLDIMDEQYEIENNYLPTHVSFSLASKILNTGRLLSLLRHAPFDADTLPGFQNGDFGVNEEKCIKIMEHLEKGDNYDLSNVEKVVNFVWNSVNKVK